MSIFKKAIRAKLRFNSSKGILSTEDLFDLNKSQLHNLYVSLDEQTTKGNGLLEKTVQDQTLQLKMEIVKDVFETKEAEKEARQNIAARKAKEQRILEILQKKQDESLENLTEDELKKMLEEL